MFTNHRLLPVFLVFSILGLMPKASFAQQNYTLYNMSSIAQSMYFNPSNFPVNNVNLGLPLLSSNYFGVTNTAFRYNDIVFKRPDDSLTVDVDA
jgi:hypothetical protein